MPGAPDADNTDVEHDTLAQHAQWLRAQADTIATVEPVLRNAIDAARPATEAMAAEIRALGGTARLALATGREAVERLAVELEGFVHVRAHDGDLTASNLFRRRRDRHLAPGRSPSLDEAAHLVADVSYDLPGDEGERCRVRLTRATDSELSLLSDLVEAGLTHDQLLRLLEGGHLLLPGHRLLDGWKALPGVTPRTSSHYHPDDRHVGRGPRWVEAASARAADAHAHPRYGQQYGLKGRFVHEALFGPGPNHTTFVQLERAAPSKLRLAQHVADWVRYRLSRRNQGPYGSSVDTDAHPIRGARWWRPSARSDQAVQLQQIATETDRIVRAVLDVHDELDARGRLRAMVWRGPSSDDFDSAVESTSALLATAAAAVHAFGAKVRREERLI